MKNLKTMALLSVMAVAAPLSASALGFYGDVGAGDTYNFSDGQQTIVAQALGPEAAGSFSFDITNDQGSVWTYNFGEPFINNALPDGLFMTASTPTGTVTSTGPFSLALNPGETSTITVSYSALSRGDVLGARFSAVPLPAGIVLLLSALGMAALLRGRKNGPVAA